jgi:hypothetical protein
VGRVGTDYIFVNDHGTEARFRYVGPRRLAWVGGGWDPNVVVTVGPGGRGRTLLRFDAPFMAPGFWISAD